MKGVSINLPSHLSITEANVSRVMHTPHETYTAMGKDKERDKSACPPILTRLRVFIYNNYYSSPNGPLQLVLNSVT